MTAVRRRRAARTELERPTAPSAPPASRRRAGRGRGRSLDRLRSTARLILAFVAGPVVSTASVVGTTHPFEAEIRAFEATDARTPPPPDFVLFVGSSTIARWTDLASAFPGLTVLNRGFGGSQFPDVLHFFDRVVRVHAPPLIVVYEGDNDLAAGRTVERVFGDWTNFVGRVERELPGTGVLFVAVKPSPSRLGFLAAQRELNRRIAEDCAGRPRCRFVDVAGPMLDDAGRPRASLFVSDQLHLNASGYEVWRAALAPALEAWAAAHPERSPRRPTGWLLVDFGRSDRLSGGDRTGGPTHWNNLTTAVGSSNQGRLERLVTTDGTPTDAAWVMTSRFNGANQNGTIAPAPFPASATRDSLFGNTETFGGLSNVKPAFRITGLRPGVPHDLAFYASRTGVSDHRETRYTVTGTGTGSADLEVANNVDAVARLAGILPAPDGSLAVSLAPGPRNDNANHFVYLGVLHLVEAVPGGRAFLFDVGAADSTTAADLSPNAETWNDVPESVGMDPHGSVPRLLAADGTDTGASLRIVSPFAADDDGGTGISALLPTSATRDSLLGRAGTDGALAELTPSFEIGPLDPRRTYSFAFYASRMDATDRRETRYVVRGAEERSVVLEVADNVHRMAWVTGMRPDAAGGILVRLEAGPSNDNPNRFTHLGALRLEWRAAESPPPPILELARDPNGAPGLRLRTAFGRSCRLQQSTDLRQWSDFGTVTPPADGVWRGWNPVDDTAFVRLVDAGE